jgi:hypothetical protein
MKTIRPGSSPEKVTKETTAPLRISGLLVGLLAAVSGLLLVGGCVEAPIGDYQSASSVAKHGFAKNKKNMRAAQGSEIKLWGYVDPMNVFSEGVDCRPDGCRWRFDLLARPDDNGGIPVILPKDKGRACLLSAFTENENQGRPTKVIVKGTLHTFDAPMNFSTSLGLSIQARSSDDVSIVR